MVGTLVDISCSDVVSWLDVSPMDVDVSSSEVVWASVVVSAVVVLSEEVGTSVVVGLSVVVSPSDVISSTPLVVSTMGISSLKTVTLSEELPASGSVIVPFPSSSSLIPVTLAACC